MGRGQDEERDYGQGDHSHLPRERLCDRTRYEAQPSASEQMEGEMVTKMVTHGGPRAGIERDATTRASDFRNTTQQLSGQNETGRNGHQQISSAVLSTTQPPLRGRKAQTSCR